VAEALGDTLEIAFLYVDEQYRGKGIGRKLLAHAEDLERQKGMKRNLLNAYSFQAPAFYEKPGYTELLKLTPAFDDYAQSYFTKIL
jgi:N-acetylglutamate synthase and related acetyltransferases